MDDKFLYQNKILKERRKELRNNLTDAEYLLWQKLKGNKLGYKFTRQYSIGPYIVDFYCPKLKLAIELDGKAHQNPEAKLYDADREEYLKSLGVIVVRFWNSEVAQHTQDVLKTISKLAKKRGVTPS